MCSGFWFSFRVGFWADVDVRCILYYTIIYYIITIIIHILLYIIHIHIHIHILLLYIILSYTLLFFLTLPLPYLPFSSDLSSSSFLSSSSPFNIHSIRVGTYITLFIFYQYSIIPNIWPRMFYRSGWLRCVVRICIGFGLCFVLVF